MNSSRCDLILNLLNRYNLEYSEPVHDSVQIFSIKPKSPKQAAIEIYCDPQTDYLSITAGIGFSVDDLYWETEKFPIESVLDSLLHGKLVETIRLFFNGKKAGVSSYLPIEGQDIPIYSNKTFHLIGELIHRFKHDNEKIEYESYF